MIEHILIRGSLPDERGLYCYCICGGYQNDMNTYYKLEPSYTLGDDFETNTIRILELKNVLFEFNYLVNKRFLLSSLREEEIEEARSLILREIDILEKNSEIVSEIIPEFSKLPKKVYLSSGKIEAKERFLFAILRKNFVYEDELLELEKSYSLKK